MTTNIVPTYPGIYVEGVYALTGGGVTATVHVNDVADTALVAHADISGVVNQTGLNAVATGGNTDAQHGVVYSSSDATTVAVDPATGALTLNAPGTVTITATVPAHGVYAEQNVMTQVTVTAATITPDSATVDVLSAPGAPEATFGATVTAGGHPVAGLEIRAAQSYGSSWPAQHKTTDAHGKVVFKVDGNTGWTGSGTYTLTGGGATATVNVNYRADTALVAHADISGVTGQTGLSAAATGGNTDAQHAVAYNSSDATIVAVDPATGALTLKATGTATITATVAAHGIYAEQSVTTQVTVAVMAVVVNADTSVVAGSAVKAFTPVTGVGGTGALVYSVSPSLPQGLTLNVGTGEITGTPVSPVVQSVYTVTVTDHATPVVEKSATFKLTVTAATGTALVAHADVSGAVGLNGLSAAATGGNTDATHHITYTSSNESLVSVDPNTGALTLKADGVAWIKATSPAWGPYAESSVVTQVLSGRATIKVDTSSRMITISIPELANTDATWTAFRYTPIDFGNHGGILWSDEDIVAADGIPAGTVFKLTVGGAVYNWYTKDKIPRNTSGSFELTATQP